MWTMETSTKVWEDVCELRMVEFKVVLMVNVILWVMLYKYLWFWSIMQLKRSFVAENIDSKVGWRIFKFFLNKVDIDIKNHFNYELKTIFSLFKMKWWTVSVLLKVLNVCIMQLCASILNLKRFGGSLKIALKNVTDKVRKMMLNDACWLVCIIQDFLRYQTRLVLRRYISHAVITFWEVICSLWPCLVGVNNRLKPAEVGEFWPIPTRGRRRNSDRLARRNPTDLRTVSRSIWYCNDSSFFIGINNLLKK